MALDNSSALKLLLAHRGMLLGYIGSIVRNATLAEDVFQDTAILILQKREQLQDAAKFPEWARSVARFEAVNALCKQRKAPHALDESVLNSLEVHWNEADAQGDSDALEALRSCSERLTARTQKLLELRYGQSISSKEIAARMGQPVNTVYVALSRAHRTLAECIKLQLARQAPGKEVNYG